jgi:hypothetical protein
MEKARFKNRVEMEMLKVDIRIVMDFIEASEHAPFFSEDARRIYLAVKERVKQIRDMAPEDAEWVTSRLRELKKGLSRIRKAK